MPPSTQRRRRTANNEDNDHDQSTSHRRQARRANDSDDSEASEDEQEDDVDMDRSGHGDDNEDQLVQKLVRYALACEYARMPIRRDGIRDKGENTIRLSLVQYSAAATAAAATIYVLRHR